MKNFSIWKLLFSFFSNALHKCLHLVLAKERDFAFFLASQKIFELQRIKEIAPYSANHRDIVLTYSKEAVTLGSSYSSSYNFPWNKHLQGVFQKFILGGGSPFHISI